MKCLAILLFIVLHCCLRDLTVLAINEGIEEDWGDGLKVLTTYKPKECRYKAQNNDIVHYHYVGRLGNNGQVFGQSFDYNSPYIVALGQRRIIAGMDRGLVGTCLWERRRITIPPHLGYGERGVGQIIPPNSTLVFYIRLIKLERDKQTLGVIPSLEDVWNQGLTYYTNQNWQKAIEMIEESLRIFEQYQNHTKQCLQSCGNSKQQENLTNKQETLLAEFGTDVLSFLKYSIKAQCIKQCKKEKLPPSQRNPDPFVLEQFKKRVPYSYLHYSYYQIGNLEEGIKCAFTYYFYHPNDSMIVNSIAYYRKKLGLSKEDVVSREPGKMHHQQFYTSARSAYTSGEWLKSAVLIEKAIKEYKNSLNDCYLVCDDINVINITGDDVSPEKDNKLEEYEILPDSLEYYELLRSIVLSYLKCRSDCRVRTATVDGEFFDKYLPGHFHYLQFNYFKLNLLNKAAEAASTFHALEPSDTVMANNIKYYRTKLNVSPEHFIPREEIVTLKSFQQSEERLFHFAVTGNPQKRQGERGDSGVLHEEL